MRRWFAQEIDRDVFRALAPHQRDIKFAAHRRDGSHERLRSGVHKTAVSCHSDSGCVGFSMRYCGGGPEGDDLILRYCISQLTQR